MPAEVQAKLEKLNAYLRAARARRDQAGEASALNNMGATYSRLGEYRKALDYYNQSLPVRRQAGDRAGEAATLNNIGSTYSRLGENEKALDYFNQAVLISRQVGDGAGEARTLTGIGNVYRHLGEYQKALDAFGQALSNRRQASDRAGEAAALTGIGNIYFRLGDNQKTLDYYNQALPIQRQLGDRMGQAGTLNNIANVYSRMSENQSALEYYNQALPIWRQVGNRAGEAMTLNGLGYVYSKEGENQKALDYDNQALPILRQVGDRDDEATTLNNISRVYASQGERQKALDYCSRALPIAVFVNDPQLQIDILGNFFAIEKLDQPSLAVLYGKLAINLLQHLRGNIDGLEDEVQKTFLSSVADQYHDLATLLIQQGRLSEAQQVLSLLKDQEYKDYVRGETEERLGPLSLTPAERAAEEDYQRSTGKVVAQGRRWTELKQNNARTPGEEKEFQQLSESLGNASQMMNEYFARLYKVFSANGDANRQVANISDETASLQQQIAKMPHTVALYTVVSEGRYSVIVITGQTMVAREYAIPAKELHTKIADFRQTILPRKNILPPFRDAKPLAQELYKILIGPIKADLDQAKAETLIWSLDGVLRYVPFAALYDGKHYLVENYSQASFTPVSIAHISDKPNLKGVSAAAMGISAKFDEKLLPLPQVETELDSIVKDPQVKGSTGVMPGTILLNSRFTQQGMEKQLDGQRAVVHIASHFVVSPGDDSQSYLLMAGKDGNAAGYHMTVASFRDNRKISLEGTELLTLSACDTGVGGSSANGREVDGLATTAQRKGAKAVISSLWELNDNSTADIMADFYKRWVDGGGKVMKAEALRQAQIDLLLGKVTAKPDSSGSGAGGSYAQPYYWAPFVLMGNWQ